jgi:hypothetical protein
VLKKYRQNPNNERTKTRQKSQIKAWNKQIRIALKQQVPKEI